MRRRFTIKPLFCDITNFFDITKYIFLISQNNPDFFISKIYFVISKNEFVISQNRICDITR